MVTNHEHSCSHRLGYNCVVIIGTQPTKKPFLLQLSESFLTNLLLLERCILLILSPPLFVNQLYDLARRTSASWDLAMSVSVLAAGWTMSSSFMIVAPSFDIVALPADNTHRRKILIDMGKSISYNKTFLLRTRPFDRTSFFSSS